MMEIMAITIITAMLGYAMHTKIIIKIDATVSIQKAPLCAICNRIITQRERNGKGKLVRKLIFFWIFFHFFGGSFHGFGGLPILA